MTWLGGRATAMRRSASRRSTAGIVHDSLELLVWSIEVAGALSLVDTLEQQVGFIEADQRRLGAEPFLRAPPHEHPGFELGADPHVAAEVAASVARRCLG